MKFVLFFAIFASLISQHPILLDSGLSSFLNLSWILPIIFCFKNKNIIQEVSREFSFEFLLILLFFLFSFCSEMFFDQIVIGTDHKNIILSFTIFVVSYISWRFFGIEDNLNLLVYVVLVPIVIVSLFIYNSYDLINALSSRMYAYEAKNSLASIVLSGSIISFVFAETKNKRIRLLIYLICFLLIIFLFLLRSRATILSFVIIGIYLIGKSNSNHLKLLTITILGISCMYVLYNENLYDNVVNGILFANRDNSSIDSLSSGRFSQISLVLDKWQENIVFGIGSQYIDCMPIAMVVQYGIIGSSIIFLLLMSCFRKICYATHSAIRECSFLLFVSFMVNSLFEAFPPFGPGAKCFLLWMFLGFMTAEQKAKEQDDFI